MPAGNLASLGAGPVLAAMVTQAIYTCAGGLAVDQGKVLTSAPWTTWMTGWLKPLVFFFMFLGGEAFITFLKLLEI